MRGNDLAGACGGGWLEMVTFEVGSWVAIEEIRKERRKKKEEEDGCSCLVAVSRGVWEKGEMGKCDWGILKRQKKREKEKEKEKRKWNWIRWWTSVKL